MVMAGDGLAVVVDGKQSEVFEGFAQGSLVFSPNGKHVAFVGTRPGKHCMVLDGEVHEYDGIGEQGALFSTDGEHVGWVAARDGKQIAVIDGEESPPYDGISPPGLLFSPDSRRHAYSASSAGKQLVVANGEEGPLFDSVAGLKFSAKGQHLVYVATRGTEGFGVIDGTLHGPFDELRSVAPESEGDDARTDAFVVSQDGGRAGFLASRGEEWFAVHDRGKLGPYRGCAELSFSPDGSRTAFLATRGDGWFLVVDGEELSGYVFKNLTFSHDGKRMASIVKRGDKRLALIDGVEGKEYDAIEEPGVQFSADGKRTAYLATLGGDKFVVADGVESPPFKRLGKTGLAFIPNSSRTVYSVRRGEKELLVVDGVEGPLVKTFRSLSFSPDGSRYAYAAEKEEGYWTVVIDGAEYGPRGKLASGKEDVFQLLGKRTPTFSPDGTRVAYTGVRNGQYVVVVDGVEGREFDLVMRGTVEFTPDSQHIVYVAARGKEKRQLSWYLVVDGLELENGWTGFLQESEFQFHDPNHFCIRASRLPRMLLLEAEIL